MLGDPSETEAEFSRGDRCIDGFVHPARCSGLHKIRQRPRVHSSGCSGLDRRGRSQDRLHRAGSPWEKGYCESFNARFRDELPNDEVFNSLKEDQILIEQWNHSGHCCTMPCRSAGNTTTPNDHTVPWAIAHRPQKPSSQWNQGQSCTNIQSGPLD